MEQYTNQNSGVHTCELCSLQNSGAHITGLERNIIDYIYDVNRRVSSLGFSYKRKRYIIQDHKNVFAITCKGKSYELNYDYSKEKGIYHVSSTDVITNGNNASISFRSEFKDNGKINWLLILFKTYRNNEVGTVSKKVGSTYSISIRSDKNNASTNCVKYINKTGKHQNVLMKLNLDDIQDFAEVNTPLSVIKELIEESIDSINDDLRRKGKEPISLELCLEKLASIFEGESYLVDALNGLICVNENMEIPETFESTLKYANAVTIGSARTRKNKGTRK